MSPKPGSWAAKVASSPSRKDVTSTTSVDKPNEVVPAIAQVTAAAVSEKPTQSVAAAGVKKAQAQAVSGDRKVKNGASLSAKQQQGGATKRQFVGNCHKCGEKGHRAAECKNEEKEV